jgi:acyl carrier protein
VQAWIVPFLFKVLAMPQLTDAEHVFFLFLLFIFCFISYFASCLTKKIKVMSEIKDKIVSIIVDKLGVEPGEVTNEASFTNDLGADSLDTVELIMEFEKEFNIAIPDDQAEKIGTVGDAIKYIEENKG